jgi:aldehyde dehydrogenase (NAD+)
MSAGASIFNAGQVCSAMSRLIVHEAFMTRWSKRERNGEIALGRARDRAYGVRRQHGRDGIGKAARPGRIDGHRGAAIRARAVTGGHAMNRPGWFLEPTIFDQVSPDMEIAREEVFGPVLSVLSFRDDDEAIAIANGTDYGLVGGVFTRDLDRATRVARCMRAGQVFVNEWYAGGVETPFGGYGKSGYGREKGREALWNYVQTKNIAIRLGV